MKIYSFSFGMVVAMAGALAASTTPVFEPGEADRLAKQLALESQPWAQLPWQVSLSDALEVAAAERKPIFMIVNTGNCLGYV